MAHPAGGGSGLHPYQIGVNENATGRRKKIICAALLVLITALVYWPVTGFDFTNYDDPDYITYNPIVQQGVTGPTVAWAFTTDHASNWHPLTWISHELDCEMYGLKPGGHHLTNLLFHLANTVLLFWLLEGLTGAMWRSALVAALFAWHPLHVESVAWVSERKDVLCTFFWLLTLAAYAKYATGSKKNGAKPWIWYGLALIFYALGLLSKPMVVTLPFVLLLLDFWPLARCPKSKVQSPKSEDETAGVSWTILLAEKVPFFVLSGLECMATIWAQKSGNSVVTAVAFPVPARIANALVGYVLYLWKTVWPVDLAVPYPFSHEWTFVQAAGAGVLLAAITAAVLWRLRTQPYLAVGWFWFLGTLVPVIGLVQVGMQFMADRYTYVPLMGVFIAVAWSIPSGWTTLPRPGRVFATATGAILVALLLVTRVQLFYWQNSITLFTHTVAVTQDNILAEYNLGEALARADAKEEAEKHYLKALAIKPNRVEAQYNSQPQARFNLAVIYLHEEGKLPDAEALFETCVRENPGEPRAHAALATTLLAMGRTAEGIQEEREVVRLNPNDVESMNRLAWLLATQSDAKLRDGAEAARLAEHVRDMTGGRSARYLATLDAAYAEAGRFPDAIAAAQKTRDAAQAQGQTDLAAAAEQRLKLYEAGKPFHE
jgi:protein O-mannosyl-transferase